MFTAEIKINATTIISIYGYRTMSFAGHDATHVYAYEYHEPGQRFLKGTVTHVYCDGLGALLVTILNDVKKKGHPSDAQHSTELPVRRPPRVRTAPRRRTQSPRRSSVVDTDAPPSA